MMDFRRSQIILESVGQLLIQAVDVNPDFAVCQVPCCPVYHTC